MERLTIPDVRVDEHTTRRTIIDARVVREHAMDFYWRLKAYEDTGLTPKEVTAIGELFDYALKESKTLTEQLALLNRIRDLAEADRDGRLVMPPCKAGDTVYEVTSRKTISEYRVKAIRVELFCTFIEWDIVAGFVGKSIFGVPVDEIGKTVFLTREEAKEALEAMREEEAT